MQTTLPKPKSQLAEVLHALITEPEITERDFYQNGFRSRLTDIRNLGLMIRDKWKEKPNKFHRRCRFKVHYLWNIEKKRAAKLYEKINKA
jgi:hypothetical protein